MNAADGQSVPVCKHIRIKCRTGGRVQAVALEILSRQGQRLPQLRPDLQQLLPGLLGSRDAAIRASTLSLLRELLQSEADDNVASALPALGEMTLCR